MRSGPAAAAPPPPIRYGSQGRDSRSVPRAHGHKARASRAQAYLPLDFFEPVGPLPTNRS